MPIKISIITVVYNRANVIECALNSFQSQTYPHKEHVIIDGASTDGTLEILNANKRKFDILVSEQDQGIYHAMNKGISKATGDVIGILNSDDFYATPDVLTKIVSAFEDETLDACYGDLCYVNPKNINHVARYWKSSNHRPGMFSRGWCPPHPSFFVRRRIYDQLGGFNLNYRIASDVELMMRFMEKGVIKSKYIPEVLVKMRLGGITNNNFFNIFRQNYEVLLALKKNGIYANPLTFFACKLASRWIQKMTRPNL